MIIRILRAARVTARRLAGQVRGLVLARNRRVAIVLMLVTVVIAVTVGAAHVSEWWFSPGAMIVPILFGGLLLWPRTLWMVLAVAAGGLIYDAANRRAGAGIITAVAITGAFAWVFARIRGELGTLGLRGDQMLLELRDRIRAQGVLPDLGEGWGSAVVLRPAGGSAFGGDFVVSARNGDSLEVALVDVSGKGIDAGTRALLLSGAFGGLLGSVPATRYLSACNAYLRRGKTMEDFVTAVHLAVDLSSGEYVLSSGGHPPAVRYDRARGRWRVTQARGIVLGVAEDVASVQDLMEKETLQHGDAIMLYTDGLVEAPGEDIDVGIGRLLGQAQSLVTTGFGSGAPGLVTALQRAIGGSDDCALVLIWRS